MSKIAIVGSGVAGLAASVRLSNQGHEVHVFEKNHYPGGKLSQFESKGYRFDAGPSLFTMPQYVLDLYVAAGKDSSSFQYIKKDVICRYFWEDGTVFTAYADPEIYIQEACRIFNTSPKEIRKYWINAAKKFDLTHHLFLEKSLHRLSTYLHKDTLKAICNIFALDVFSTLDSVNKAHFSDLKLIQIFNRYATYNGSSPYMTPGIMSMIPHLEQHYGTNLPTNGMINITQSIYELAISSGAYFHFNTPIDEILVKANKVTGIKTKGNTLPFDVVVSNMDVVPSYNLLLKDQKKPHKTLKQDRSSSALIFYWGIKASFGQLDLHNILFSDDYVQEFDYIFRQNTVYRDPTIYINITSKNIAEDAPHGCENWFVMVNTPGDKGQDWNEIVKSTRENIFLKLNRLLRCNIESLIETEDILTPKDIESKTSSYQGSLYGAASNNKFSAFLRHPNFSPNIKNLYFCGGSVHPGGGIPLCLLSGKIVSDLIGHAQHN